MNKFRERTGIYHEHQEGALCAQHAINNLLQNPFFTAVNLADIARELDLEENKVLVYGLDESENMDDTGFFNIQVIQRTLQPFGIELIPYTSQHDIARCARTNPLTIQAVICNLGLHWFTIRRFGRQYFDLNSMFYIPHMIPSLILEQFLNCMQTNHHSIFIVHGELPECLADQQLAVNPLSESEYVQLNEGLPTYYPNDEIVEQHKKLLSIKVPRELFDTYRKNPTDPQIQKRLIKYATQQFLYEDIEEYEFTKRSVNNSNYPHTSQLQSVNRQEYTLEQLMTDKSNSDPSQTIGVIKQTNIVCRTRSIDDEARTEQLNNSLLEYGIQASLANHDSTVEKSKNSPKLIVKTNDNPNSAVLPTSTVNLEKKPTIDLMSASSAVTENTSKFNTISSSTSNSSDVPTNNLETTSPTEPTFKSVTSPSSSASNDACSDVMKTLSIEEFRKLRLMKNGYKFKSIISEQSNFDDD